MLAAIAIGAIKQGTKKNNCKKCRVNKRSRSLMMMVQIYLQHCPTLLEGKEGFDLYTFKYNELLSREDLWQASEFVQLYSHIWNKDLGKLVTSELVRAIIDDDPLKMRRLADLFQINVAELNQMWVFDSVDSQSWI